MIKVSDVFFASMLFASLSAFLTLPVSAEGQYRNSEFEVTDISGKSYSFSIPSEGIVVFEWFNQGCPFVQKFYKDGFMQSLHAVYREKGVHWYVVSSTSPSHPDFLSVEARNKLVSDWNMDQGYFIFDESGAFGSNIGAKTTPHMFIFRDGTLLYSGAVDSSPDTDSNPHEAENFIKDILDALIENTEVVPVKNRPYGCSVKYAK
jgi:hypothetical protein